ncbi:MAG: hypothetical protein MPL62_17900, partial [Alphaproteobacteria bacterium]|nr:hypothetical protein [Alphaproteobacteria bacterium]
MSGSPARVSAPVITMVRPAVAPDCTVTGMSTLAEAAAAGMLMLAGVLKLASVPVAVPPGVPVGRLSGTDTASSHRAVLVTSAMR